MKFLIEFPMSFLNPSVIEAWSNSWFCVWFPEYTIIKVNKGRTTEIFQNTIFLIQLLNINLGFGGTFVVCIQKRLRMSSTTEVHQVWLSRCSHIPHMCLRMEVPIKMNGFQRGRLRALFRATDHKVKVCLWFWSSWKFLVPTFSNHIFN